MSDTRGRLGDRDPQRPATEGGADTDSAQLVELGPVGQGPRGGSRQTLLIAGVVLAALGAIALSGRPAGPPQVSSMPSSLLALPSPSPTTRPPSPIPTAAPDPWVWRSYDATGFEPKSELREVWSLGHQFVALIAVPSSTSEGPERQSLLRSTDGLAWTQEPLPVPGLLVVHGVVIDGALWLIGAVASDEGLAWQAWSSTDAVTWMRATSFDPALEDVQNVLGLAHASAGWVAIVETQPPDEAPVMTFRHSVDGVAWTTPALSPEINQDRAVVAIATDGAGFVVALERNDQAVGSGLDVLASDDGTAWTLEAVAEDGVRVSGLAYGVGGYVIVGEVADEDHLGEPVAWNSTDGRAWDELRMPIGSLPAGLSPVGPFRVIPTDRGYLATSQANGMAWTSADGLRWSAFNVWPSVNEFMLSAAVVDDIVVGARADPGRVGFLRGNLLGMIP